MPAPLAVFWICAIACALAHVGILRSVVRRSSAPAADVPRPRLLLEIVWAVIPMIVLATVLLATFPRARARAYTPHVMHDMSTMTGTR